MIAALYLDRIYPRSTRYNRRLFYLLCACVSVVIALFSPFVRMGTAFLAFFLAAYIWKCMCEGMYLSHYVQAQKRGVDYWKSYAEQYGILALPFAREAFLRLGISVNDVLGKNMQGGGDSFSEFITSIFTDNHELRSFLEKNGVTKNHWIGVWTWLEHRESEIIESALILDQAHIARLSSIGEAFSYGQTYNLNKIGREMSGLSLSESLEHFYSRVFSLLDQSLKKSEGSNALIIADSVEDAEGYVKAFIPHMIKKKFIRCDTEFLISVKDASEFEHLFTRALQEAMRAGNVIFVIPHIASIIHAAHALGYDVMLTLTEYMRHPNLHIIICTDRKEFHQTLETNAALIRNTDKIELDAIAPELLQSVAESEVISVETRHKVIFSYQAICAVADAVLRFGSSNLHDTLKDYLDESVIFNKRYDRKVQYITEAMMAKYLAEKTGTQGTFVDTSSDKLKNIDIKEILSNRVKGQESAILSVANVMERVRAGLVANKKPQASFLFLGPTGVGKTETAKALAEGYFGTENKIIRFDMSEFSDARGMNRLIGSFELGEAGMLAIKARDTGHGVMLFDEIDKAHENVRDLMLQILDEGYFTDSKGERINMRNFIIVATSNAGSDQIYQASSRGQKVDKKNLIDSIISSGIFRPEFLNRFDEIAVFNALGDSELAHIARLKLGVYANKIYEKKAIHMNITDELVTHIIANIENKAFGGRDIMRTIHNHIESTIAKDIISGRAHRGSTVTFTYNLEEKMLKTQYT